MTLGHEKLDVYRLSIGYVAWVYDKAEADRRRYFEIARRSALECAAIQDALVVGKALDRAESRQRKTELDRMAAMLSRLGVRGHQVREQQEVYGADPDSDFDLEGQDGEPQPSGSRRRLRARLNAISHIQLQT